MRLSLLLIQVENFAPKIRQVIDWYLLNSLIHSHNLTLKVIKENLQYPSYVEGIKCDYRGKDLKLLKGSLVTVSEFSNCMSIVALWKLLLFAYENNTISWTHYILENSPIILHNNSNIV